MKKEAKESAVFQPNHMKILKVIVLAFILLAVEFLVGAFVFTKTKDFSMSEMQGVYGEAVKSVSADISKRLKDGADLAPDFSTEITGSGDERFITLNEKQYRVAAWDRLKVNGAVNIYMLSEVCNNQSADEYILSDKTVYAIYGTIAAGEDIVHLNFCKLDRVFDGVNVFGFDGYAIFSESKRVLYAIEGGGAMTDEAFTKFKNDFSYKTEMPAKDVSTPVLSNDDAEYMFAINRIEGFDYYVGGFVDGTALQKSISDLGIFIIIFFVVLAILTIVTVVLLAVMPSSATKGGEYRIVTDSFGKIVSSNGKFRTDFPETRVIKERVNAFDEARHYALSLENAEGEVLLSASAKRKEDGAIILSADRVNIPYGSRVETEQGKSMKGIYEGFKNQKHLLVGELLFENLSDVLDIFGKDFAEFARNSLIDRINEKFKYVYPIDYHHIGILQPEGKEYDEVMRDMHDYFEYFNKVIKMPNNNIIKVNVRGGFAIVDDVMQSRDFDYVFLCADAALRRTDEKTDETVRNVYYYIYNESQRKLYEKYFFKIDIPKMLEEGDFYLEYQPQYDVNEERIVAFEALFRVKQRVQVHASVFQIITYAEQSGYMVQLGEFIFRTGMAFAKSIEGTNVSVSLNVSLVQLMQFGFVDHFMQLYRDFDLKPGSISIELTESFLARKMDETIQKLKILNANGIGIHLDDFGTTYSSFNYLQKLPITAIKVDQSFLRDIHKNEYNRLITSVIINLSRDLNLRSICEGVETKEQLTVLKELNVDVIQGYLISRSVDEEKAREMIDNFKYVDPDEAPEAVEDEEAAEDSEALTEDGEAEEGAEALTEDGETVEKSGEQEEIGDEPTETTETTDETDASFEEPIE